MTDMLNLKKWVGDGSVVGLDGFKLLEIYLDNNKLPTFDVM